MCCNKSASLLVHERVSSSADVRCFPSQFPRSMQMHMYWARKTRALSVSRARALGVACARVLMRFLRIAWNKRRWKEKASLAERSSGECLWERWRVIAECNQLKWFCRVGRRRTMIDCSGTVAVCTRGENSRKSTFELMFRHRLSQVALMYFKSTFTTKDSFFVEICVLYRRGNARILLRLRRWSTWSKRYRNTQSHNPSACLFFNFGFF